MGAKNSVKLDTTNVPQFVMDMVCSPLLEIIEDYYKNPVNVKKFIKWHKKRYGYPPINIEALNAVLESSEAVAV